MELSALKRHLSDIEALLDANPVIDLCDFETPHGKLAISISERLRRSCQRGDSGARSRRARAQDATR